MEVQKKLIGDGGDNLISPSRVSLKLLVLLPGHFCYVITHRDGYTDIDTQYTGTDTGTHTVNLLLVALQFSSLKIRNHNIYSWSLWTTCTKKLMLRLNLIKN